MKKFIMILLSLTMVFTLVACGKSSKYDEELNKILAKEKLNRDEINFKVYDVDFHDNRDSYSGRRNVYKITSPDNSGGDTDIYFLTNDGDVYKVKALERKLVLGMMQVQVYEEINNKNLKEEY